MDPINGGMGGIKKNQPFEGEVLLGHSAPAYLLFPLSVTNTGTGRSVVCLSVLSLQVIGCYHRDFPYFTLEHPLGHLRLPHLLLQLGLGEVLAELRKALLSVLLPPKRHVGY